MKKIILFFFLSLFINVCVIAQLKLGVFLGVADSSSVLDAGNTGPGANALKLGFIPPKVALTSNIIWGLAGTTTVDGMLVYNTVSAGTGATAVIPGYYYWLGTNWVSLSQQPVGSAVATATFNCNNNTININPQTAGFTNNTPYSGTITVPFTAGVYGTYPIDATTISGITVSRNSGTINSATGTLTYTISGTFTGTTGTSLTFTLSLPGGTTCSVSLPLVSSFTAGTLNCQIPGNPVVGTYSLNLPTTGTSSNSKLVSITPATAGSYTISTNTINGISFTASGIYTQAQVGTLVSSTLIATGTPTGVGNAISYTVSIGGQTCSFPVNINAGGIFNCTNAVLVQSPMGPFYTGTAYTGSFTIPYTTGNGLAYSATTNVAIDGISFNRVAGVYAAGGGNIVYNLSGTYTGPNAGTPAYTISECSSPVAYGLSDGIRASLSSSISAYDAASVNNYGPITQAEYDNLGTVVLGTTNYGMKLADRNLTVSTAGYVNFMPANNIPTTAYPFAFSTKLGSGLAACIRLITQVNSVGAATVTNWSTAAYNFTPGSAATYYFVIKRPNITMPANTNIAVHGFNNGWGNSGGGSGADGVTSSNMSSGSADNSTDCTIPAGSVASAAISGNWYSTGYLNYDIKWTNTKQW